METWSIGLRHFLDNSCSQPSDHLCQVVTCVKKQIDTIVKGSLDLALSRVQAISFFCAANCFTDQRCTERFKRFACHPRCLCVTHRYAFKIGFSLHVRLAVKYFYKYEKMYSIISMSTNLNTPFCSCSRVLFHEYEYRKMYWSISMSTLTQYSMVVASTFSWVRVQKNVLVSWVWVLLLKLCGCSSSIFHEYEYCTGVWVWVLLLKL